MIAPAPEQFERLVAFPTQTVARFEIRLGMIGILVTVFVARIFVVARIISVDVILVTTPVHDIEIVIYRETIKTTGLY